MNIRYSLIAASAVLAISPVAFAEESVQATQDCAALVQKFDQAASAATAEQLNQAKAARDAGEKLCAEGKSAEGAAKLNEAISQIAGPSQQPSS
jgi:16S rRNA G1207 methylase RsmC